MKILRITNTQTNEILNEEEFLDSEIGQAQARWNVQIELYKLDGIESRLDLIDPSAPIVEAILGEDE